MKGFFAKIILLFAIIGGLILVSNEAMDKTVNTDTPTGLILLTMCLLLFCWLGVIKLAFTLFKSKS